MKKHPPTSAKARASTGYAKHLRKPGKRVANKGTRRILKTEDWQIGMTDEEMQAIPKKNQIV